MIKNITVRSEGTQFDLTVVEDGAKITVMKGAFRHVDQDVQLADDFEYTLVERAVAADIDAYLVKNRKTGEYEVLVDEVEADRVDLPHDFATGDYVLVEALWSAVVPAATSTFTGLNVTVYRVVGAPAAAAPRAPRVQEKEAAVVAAHVRNAVAKAAKAAAAKAAAGS